MIIREIFKTTVKKWFEDNAKIWDRKKLFDGIWNGDIVIFDEETGKVAIFEAKYSKEAKHLEQDCDRAIHQINEKMYAREFEDAYDEVLCYGIAFYKKRCLVKKK